MRALPVWGGQESLCGGHLFESAVGLSSQRQGRQTAWRGSFLGPKLVVLTDALSSNWCSQPAAPPVVGVRGHPGLGSAWPPDLSMWFPSLHLYICDLVQRGFMGETKCMLTGCAAEACEL